MTIELIILDRDGVINYDSPNYIKSPAEWIPIPGSLPAIARLNQQGYKIAIATNQSGIARGYYDEAMLTAIHQQLQAQLALVGGHIDAIFYCPHLPGSGCLCRKPAPGLLYQARDYFAIPLDKALMIGDSLRDLQAAEAAGCPSILVKTGNGASTLEKHPQLKMPIFADLQAAVMAIIA